MKKKKIKRSDLPIKIKCKYTYLKKITFLLIVQQDLEFNPRIVFLFFFFFKKIFLSKDKKNSLITIEFPGHGIWNNPVICIFKFI